MFETALLCPRIALEPLAPWRRVLAAAFPEAERARFRSDPAALWAWVEGHIREEDDTYPDLPATPLGIFRLKAAAPGGREVLFCALCRSLGVPARLNTADGRPEYWRAGAFRPVGQEAPAAAVTLRAPAGQPGVFHQNYTLARRTPPGLGGPGRRGRARGGAGVSSPWFPAITGCSPPSGCRQGTSWPSGWTSPWPQGRRKPSSSPSARAGGRTCWPGSPCRPSRSVRRTAPSFPATPCSGSPL